MVITIPDNFIAERSYILTVFFNEFLGIEYKLKVDSGVMDYCMKLDNGNELIVKDFFFSNFNEKKGYLEKQNIPDYIKQAKNRYYTEDVFPIIFGNEELEVELNKIICGIDVFASSFFMLTRWEEYVNKTRDRYERFPAKESLAHKFDFIDKPVVNIYAEMLYRMLQSIGCIAERKERSFKIIATHDVDIHKRWRGFAVPILVIAGDILKRKNLKLALKNILSFIASKFNHKKDPYYTFDFFMDLSEKAGIKARFFFMSGGGKGEFKDEDFYKIDTPFIRKLIKHIESRGHLIGFHPSFYTYNDHDLWEHEYEKIKAKSNSRIEIGRQHMLRFEVPFTWQIWDDYSMRWDSTVYYSESPGFRCGTCYEYSVFNILSRKQLNLKEQPMAFMECSMVDAKISPSDMEKKVIYLINTVKKFDGNFVFLWHNSSFNNPQYGSYQYIYEKIFENI